MTHTFFENNSNYQIIETREVDQFDIDIAFAPDDTQLDLLFDTDMEGYDELVENLESGFWQHMICRVQAKYDGTVMGEDYLGSCVAEDGADFQEQSPDLIADMIETALEEARKGIAELKAKLIADFG